MVSPTLQRVPDTSNDNGIAQLFGSLSKIGAVLVAIAYAAGSQSLASYFARVGLQPEGGSFLSVTLLSEGFNLIAQVTIGPLFSLMIDPTADWIPWQLRNGARIIQYCFPVLFLSIFAGYPTWMVVAPNSTHIKATILLLLTSYVIFVLVHSARRLSAEPQRLFAGIVLAVFLLMITARYQGWLYGYSVLNGAPWARLIVKVDDVTTARAMGLRFSNTKTPTVSDPVKILELTERNCSVRFDDGRVLVIARNTIAAIETGLPH
jgi:hypothetical protein